MSNILVIRTTFSNGKIAVKTLLREYLKSNQHNVHIRHSSETPVQVLERKISEKKLLPDAYQMKAMTFLNNLHEQLLNYTPKMRAAETQGGFFSIFKGNNRKDHNRVETDAPKGVYLHGGVGGGKTTIMNIFYNCCDMVPKKQRIHYTSFMNKVHSRIHDAKLEMNTRANDKTPFDPTLPVANSIANESWLLCLDEFQVTDIADAMILKRLFTHLFNNGVVLVATSNRPPDDLYKNGLQRSQFLPFIPMLKSRCEIVSVDGGVDYRQLAAKGTGDGYFFVKSKVNADQEIDRMFKILCTQENDTIRPKTITHFGRDLTFAKTCGQVLDSSFSELCDRPLSGNDYIQVSQYFHTVIIRDVPELTSLLKSQFRRFVTLIDNLYDNKIRVIISCDVSVEELFVLSSPTDLSDEHRVLMDDLKIEHGSQESAASVFTNSEEIFAIDRARSRLNEMQTQQYWQEAGKGR
ncbi:putative ATPase N2B [Condylostylus longicornis]|uniref:putative ATPase N2B n=1 Tax=Condylostylus longicornis TaxID=2530218 RepID=UPI00244E26F5|nr:putative ATPase N2B [Condylostylus longicornis]XP_055387555.1 putative ATPase N2B [Condylostylus longicornis]